MKNIYTLGETTFDIILKNGEPIASKVGGSILNTSVSLGRLGMPVNLVATCANDEIGRITIDFLQKNGVNTSLLSVYEGTSRISLAFLDEQNNATYSFYNGKSVSSINQLFPEVFENDILLFGSSFAIKEEIRDQLVQCIDLAKKNKAMVYYDPNVRPHHLIGNERVTTLIKENIGFAEVVKGSDEDFKILFNTNTAEEVYDIIKEINNKAILIITNKKEVCLFTSLFEARYPVPNIEPVSTIGAGDTFSAGIVYGLCKAGIEANNLSNVSEISWEKVVGYGITFAQEVCMSYENYISLK